MDTSTDTHTSAIATSNVGNTKDAPQQLILPDAPHTSLTQTTSLTAVNEQYVVIAAIKCRIYKTQMLWTTISHVLRKSESWCQEYFDRVLLARVNVFTVEQDIRLHTTVKYMTERCMHVEWGYWDTELGVMNGKCKERWTLYLSKMGCVVVGAQHPFATSGDIAQQVSRQTLHKPHALPSAENDETILLLAIKCRFNGWLIPWGQVASFVQGTIEGCERYYLTKLSKHVHSFTVQQDHRIYYLTKELISQGLSVVWSDLDGEFGRESGECERRWERYLCKIDSVVMDGQLAATPV